MGFPVAFRKLLLDVLARRREHALATGGNTPGECVFAELPQEERTQGFDIVALDLMQEMALVKQAKVGDGMTGAMLARRIKSVLYNHLHYNAEAPGEVVASSMVIACMDNHFTVPRNKSFVQSGRDSGSVSGNADPDSPPLASSGSDLEPPSGDVVMDANAHAIAIARARDYMCSEAFEAEMLSSKGDRAHSEATAQKLANEFSEFTHFLVTEGPLPADGVAIWRSMFMRWQLTRFVAEAVCSMNLPQGKRVLFDDGVIMNREQYADLAARMISDHERMPGALSPFERATLVGQLMSSCMRRLVLSPGHRYQILPSTGIGEADLKLLYYVQRSHPIGATEGHGRKLRYMIKCQDTDVMWQLLLHMRTLINPETGNVDEVDVWMDTQTPGDRSRGTSQPYRFINMVALWRQTMAMLREEFPTLRNPMEWLFFIVACNRNDYVEPIAPAFSVGPMRIWTLCAQAAALASQRSRYPMPSVPVVKRPKVPELFPEKLAVRIADIVISQERPGDTGAVEAELMLDGVVHDYPIFLRSDAVVSMFYYLLQTSPVIKKMVTKYSNTSRWAGLLESHVASPEEFLSAVHHLHQHHTQELPEAERASVPPLFGIPTLPEMRARVARIQWTMNYYINGWKTTTYTHSWARHTAEYSLHGWCTRDVTGQMLTNGNSQYLYSVYEPPRILSDEERVPGHYRYFQVSPAFEVKQSIYT